MYVYIYIDLLFLQKGTVTKYVRLCAVFLRVHVFPVEYLTHQQNHEMCLRINCNLLIAVIYIRKCLMEWEDLPKKLKMK